MTTPGIAGGLVMVITNALALKFDFGQYLAHTVLLLSFIVGLVVFKDLSARWYEKIAFYILNSLIIFSIATGTNTVGKELSSNSEKIDFQFKKHNNPEFLPEPLSAENEENRYFKDWFGETQ
jgi:hypothetical protein